MSENSNRKELPQLRPEQQGWGSEHYVMAFAERFEHNERLRFPTREEAVAWAKERAQTMEREGEPYSVRVVDNVSGLTLYDCRGPKTSGRTKPAPVPQEPGDDEGQIYVVHIEPDGEIPASNAFFRRDTAVGVGEDAANLLRKQGGAFVVRVTAGQYGEEIARWTED